MLRESTRISRLFILLICVRYLSSKSCQTRDDYKLHGNRSVVKLFTSQSCTSGHVGRRDVTVTGPAAPRRAPQFEV